MSVCVGSAFSSKAQKKSRKSAAHTLPSVLAALKVVHAGGGDPGAHHGESMILNSNEITNTRSEAALRAHVLATGGGIDRYEAFKSIGMAKSYCHALIGAIIRSEWMLTCNLEQIAIRDR